jgi:hypothetical protein
MLKVLIYQGFSGAEIAPGRFFQICQVYDAYEKIPEITGFLPSEAEKPCSIRVFDVPKVVVYQGFSAAAEKPCGIRTFCMVTIL